MGTPSRSGCARTARTKWSPLMRGIIMSLRITSGRSVSAFSRPSWPSTAVTVRYVAASVCTMKWLISALSSTTKARACSVAASAGTAALGASRGRNSVNSWLASAAV